MSKAEELHKTIYEMMTGKYVTDLHLLYKMAHEAKLEAAQLRVNSERATRCACGNVISPNDKCEGCAGLV